MTFTELQGEILGNCYWLAREGKGQVVTDEALPEADQLVEQGWLERRTVDANGEIAFFWSPQAEAAIDVNALARSVEGREN